MSKRVYFFTYEKTTQEQLDSYLEGRSKCTRCDSMNMGGLLNRDILGGSLIDTFKEIAADFNLNQPSKFDYGRDNFSKEKLKRGFFSNKVEEVTRFDAVFYLEFEEELSEEEAIKWRLMLKTYFVAAKLCR